MQFVFDAKLLKDPFVVVFLCIEIPDVGCDHVRRHIFQMDEGGAAFLESLISPLSSGSIV